MNMEEQEAAYARCVLGTSLVQISGDATKIELVPRRK